MTGAKSGSYIWHDEFDGPAGSAPDRSKWTISNHRTPIRRPVGWDRPEFFYQYRDNRKNVFLDGNSNLVIRGTREGNTFFGGLVHGNWRGGIGTTWEARIKLNYPGAFLEGLALVLIEMACQFGHQRIGGGYIGCFHRIAP